MTQTHKIQISHPLIVFISLGALESHSLDYSKVKKTESPGNNAKRQSQAGKREERGSEWGSGRETGRVGNNK